MKRSEQRRIDRRLEEAIRDLASKALNPNYSITQLLREISFLGSRIGSPDLTQWANLELNGYGDDAPIELPEYRKVNAVIMADIFGPRGHVENHQLSKYHFHEAIRENISTDFEIVHSLPMIESFMNSPDLTLKFALPGNAELAAIMNLETGDSQKYERIYWSVPRLAMNGVVEGVRNKLVSLLADLGSARSVGDISIVEVLNRNHIGFKNQGVSNRDSILNRITPWYQGVIKISNLITAILVIFGAVIGLVAWITK